MDGIGPEITTKHCPKSHLFISHHNFYRVVQASTFYEQALRKTNQTYPKLLLGNSSTGGCPSGNLLTALPAAPPEPTLYFRSLWSAFQLSSIQMPPVFPSEALCTPSKTLFYLSHTCKFRFVGGRNRKRHEPCLCSSHELIPTQRATI